MGMFRKMEPFDFVTRVIWFVKLAYYASIVNKPNFRNVGEQNVHMYIFDLSKHNDLNQ